MNIKNIVSERNSLSNYKYIKLNKYNLGFLSLFFADIITVQLKSYINDYPKLLRRRIKVVPNLLYINSTYEEPSLDKRIITMMGRLCPQKNFTPLLDQYLERDFYHKSLISFVKDRPGHDKRYAIDSNLILEEIVWKTKFSFENGLKNTVSWYLNNKSWCDFILRKSGYEGQRIGNLK